jgi:succinyl-CoA synthetase beta subunit
VSPGDGAVQWLPEHEGKELLRGAGVPVVCGRVVADEDAASVALHELGGPVAVKVSAASIQHKSELGGVELGVDSVPSMRAAYRRLAAIAASVDGVVLVERMAAPGAELIVAARTDGIVPALVVGLGGIWTEVLSDVAVVPLPASASRVESALRSLRGAAVLTGGRGRPPLDIGAAARLAAQVGELLIERGLALIELNPVIVGERGAVAVDAAMLGCAVVGALAARGASSTT